ncbi:heat shock 70 kDa protein 4-like [Planococcus citri]|uniref:heat shock 70 kDa protein 4-like n=1 Tax=Planococcus citri TaxID=170843 RepID=UPI0031F74320
MASPSMFVIGIDFGNESSYIAVPRDGGIETISNDFSLRATPSCVAFSNRNRILGVAAKNQLITNLKNTIFGFKRLLGKNFDDPTVQHELRYAPYPIIRCKDGTIGVKVRYLDEEYAFSIQQITAMFFTKLKESAEVAMKCEVNQCVISVPSFFDNAQRLALLDAATIAGLNVLRIFNETAATALSYGIYKQDLPTPEEPPRNVIFVDCGHSSLQVSACAFNLGELKMLSSAADPQLGGRDIDIILAEYFSEQFKSKYNIEPTKNHRAMLRLLGEVEKLKKQMSANSTKIPLNIECFINDIDVHGDLKRTDMEELCAELFERVERTMLKCLRESKLKKEEIHSIEIVGGSSRVPAIKSLIEKVFGKVPSTTLNQDEAVARGCALQCAMLCPAIFVRDFSITDIQNYPINVYLYYDSPSNKAWKVYRKNHPIPLSKMLTFDTREPFELQAVYAHNNKLIGKFIVNDVKPDAKGQYQTVEVRVCITINGIFTVSKAILAEKQEIDDHGEPMEISQPHSSSKSVEKDHRIKRAVKTADLPVKIKLVGAYSSNELNALTKQECKMVSTDRQERDRIDARNALEEYVYELRGKLSSPDELATFVPDEERKKLCQLFDEIEKWIYEGGDDCNRQVYSDKLKSLQDYGEPIKKRKFEFEEQPQLLKEFSSTLQLAQRAVDQYNAGVETYSHLDKNDVRRIHESTNSALRWVEYLCNVLNVASRHQCLHITANQIKSEKDKFEQEMTKVFQKPKPQQPPTPSRKPSQEEASKYLPVLLRKQKNFIRMIDSLELTDNLNADEAKVQLKHLEKFYDEFIRIQRNIAVLIGDASKDALVEMSRKVEKNVRQIETKFKEIISSNETMPSTSAGSVVNWHFNPKDDLDTLIKKQKFMIKELESIESEKNPSEAEAEILRHRFSDLYDQFLRNDGMISRYVSGLAADEQSRMLDSFQERSIAVQNKLEGYGDD